MGKIFPYDCGDNNKDNDDNNDYSDNDGQRKKAKKKHNNNHSPDLHVQGVWERAWRERSPLPRPISAVRCWCLVLSPIGFLFLSQLVTVRQRKTSPFWLKEPEGRSRFLVTRSVNRVREAGS